MRPSSLPLLLLSLCNRRPPDLFLPYPKNRTIAKFFKEIGLVDELGSGIRNTSKYCSIYNNNKGNPEFIEGDIFKTIIPIPVIIFTKVAVEPKITFKIEPDLITAAITEALNEGVNKGVNEGVVVGGGDDIRGEVNDEVKVELFKVVQALRKTPGLKFREIVKLLGKSKRSVERYINILRKLEILTFVGSPRTGSYHLTEKMKKKLNL